MAVMKQDFSKKEVICRTVVINQHLSKMERERNEMAVINQHLSKMEREREMRWLS